MINPASETFGQARQGSVAAIIQVLNEQLADSGIRTRAVVAGGMLQILCEAPKPEQLERETVVSRVRSVLENISPSRVRKVKINSRIVKEEQLLWLEEINRNPENALLWSEVITLQRPFFVQRWLRDRHLKPAGPLIKDVTEPKPSNASLSSKVIGALGLAALLLGVLWLFRGELGIGEPQSAAELPSNQPNSEETIAIGDADEDPADKTADTTPTASPNADTPEATTNKPPGDSTPVTNNQSAPPNQSATQASNSPTGGSSGPTENAFAEAVRLAGRAAEDGLTASSRAEWLTLAAQWQRAADLMGEIPEGNPRYAVAQDRALAYQNNSQSALKQAEAKQSAPN